MKVLLDAVSVGQGGGVTYLQRLVAQDVRTPDLSVEVLARRDLELPAPGRGVRVTRAPSWLRHPLLRGAWTEAFLPLVAWRRGSDALVCPNGIVPTVRPRGCTTVAILQNLMPFEIAERRRYPLGYTRARLRFLEHVLMRSTRRADLVVFLSNHGRRVVSDRVRGPLERTAVIPHGVGDEFRTAPPGVRPGWLPDADYLLYVSTVEPYKGQLEVVRAFASLKRNHALNHRLLLVGPVSRRFYVDQVRREIARHDLQDDVLLTGPWPAHYLPAAYAHASVTVFASRCENCPNILLEAMACGARLAISDIPPTAEVAQGAALYFDPYDPASIAAQTLKLLGDQDLRQAMAKRGRSRAAEYRWAHTADRTWAEVREAHLGRVSRPLRRRSWPRRLKRELGRALAAPAVGRIAGVATSDRIRIGGITFDTSHEAYSPRVKALLFSQQYERAELAFIRRFLDPCQDVVELGASLGITGAHVLARLNAGRRYIGVEANADVIPVLESNIGSHAGVRKWDLVNAAIAPSGVHEVRLHIGPDTLAARVAVDREPQDWEPQDRPVSAVTLDGLVERFALDDYTLVSDVEGSEAAFIIPEDALSTRCRQMIIELHDTAFAGRKVTSAELRQRLVGGHGFRVVAERGPVLALER